MLAFVLPVVLLALGRLAPPESAPVLLFGAFGVKMTPLNAPVYGKLLTSAALILILAAGWLRGFKAARSMVCLTVVAPSWRCW